MLICKSTSLAQSSFTWTELRLTAPAFNVGAFACRRFGQLRLSWPTSLHVKQRCLARSRSRSSFNILDRCGRRESRRGEFLDSDPALGPDLYSAGLW